MPKATYYIYDHLGNSRVVYTPNISCSEGLGTGNPDVTYHLNSVIDYFPYGKVLREYVPGNIDERFLTTYHERDHFTGLDYRGARFYDSDVGRFLSLDPLAADYPSLSDYVYVAGNPIMFIDPTGKKVDDFYIDEDGNLLGEDGSDTDDVRVISKKAFEEISNSNDCSGGACGTNGTAELQQNSKLLSEYEKGISVSEDSWDYVTSNGGERLTPFVENNSSETIFYKPEGVEDGVNNNPHVNERGAFPIAPGTDLYSPADGVKTSNTPNGKVHRAPTGYRITVDANAEANVVNFPDWLYGYGEVTKNARRGGWANLVNSNPR